MRKQLVVTASKLLKRRDLVLASILFLFKVAEAVSASVPRKKEKAAPEGASDTVAQ